MYSLTKAEVSQNKSIHDFPAPALKLTCHNLVIYMLLCDVKLTESTPQLALEWHNWTNKTCAENFGNGAIAKWRFLVADSRRACVFTKWKCRLYETASSHCEAMRNTHCWVLSEWSRTDRAAEGIGGRVVFCWFFEQEARKNLSQK